MARQCEFSNRAILLLQLRSHLPGEEPKNPSIPKYEKITKKKHYPPTQSRAPRTEKKKKPKKYENGPQMTISVFFSVIVFSVFLGPDSGWGGLYLFVIFSDFGDSGGLGLFTRQMGSQCYSLSPFFFSCVAGYCAFPPPPPTPQSRGIARLRWKHAASIAAQAGVSFLSRCSRRNPKGDGRKGTDRNCHKLSQLVVTFCDERFMTF